MIKTRAAYVLNVIIGSVLIASFLRGGAFAAPSVPNPPYGLTAVPQKGNIVELSWIDNSSDEVGFKIDRSSTSGSQYIDVLTVPADASTCNDISVWFDSMYYYRVRATNEAGDSLPSNEVSVLTYPATPSDVRVFRVSATEIGLVWWNNNGYAQIRVEQGLSDSGPFSPIAVQPIGSQGYTCTGLTEGVRYYFRAVAFNDTGDSEPSNVVSAVTQALPPIPPGDHSVFEDLFGCSVAPGSSNETRFLPGPVTLLVAILGFRILRKRRG